MFHQKYQNHPQLGLSSCLLLAVVGLEEDGLGEESLEVCPQLGRWSSASVVVVVVDVDVDVGALVVLINRSRSTFAPPVSTKAKSLLPTPN